MHSISLCYVSIRPMVEVAIVIINSLEVARMLAEREMRSSQVFLQNLVLLLKISIFPSEFLLSYRRFRNILCSKDQIRVLVTHLFLAKCRRLALFLCIINLSSCHHHRVTLTKIKMMLPQVFLSFFSCF